jgi:adenosylmethionine-8-amino-7-oxononanoate aminotransferase
MIKSQQLLSTKIKNMVNQEILIQRDLKHIWHPCSQMKDFEQCPPLIINKAQGSFLYTNKGPIIDAISSWWCKSLGHGAPEVIQAIQDQLHQFEHVIGANTTFPSLVELGEILAAISGKQHLYFASDGCCAVEIAMKLALHANQLKGHRQKRQFISLTNSYHGETLGALSVSDLGKFKEPFLGLGVECHFIAPAYVSNVKDPQWESCEAHWDNIEFNLNALKDKVCAVIVEPIVQGGAGLLPYSADFLRRLAQWAKTNDIYLIADEIMTGLGRTGKWLACEHANVTPDMICLSKGLTSGSLPLSCVLVDHAIYDLFYSDYAEGKSFLHSHTFSANPLAVSAALATLKTMQTLKIDEKANWLGDKMCSYFKQVADISGKLINIRSIGGWVAGDLLASPDERKGFKVYQAALQHGALLRPLGNTLYWLPPLTMDEETIGKLAEITLKSIEVAYD